MTIGFYNHGFKADIDLWKKGLEEARLAAARVNARKFYAAKPQKKNDGKKR